MKKIYTLLIILFSTSLSFAQLTPSLDDVWVPMRDGDSLQADVYIPAGVDSAEVVLIQTPYNKNAFEWSLPMGVGLNIDGQPFIFVIVDWRGFYGSNMADLSNFTRGEDGYDIMDWISQQVWHKDRIGTWGPSALGGVQYNTMVENHPNYTCAVPLVATGHQDYTNYFYGGVLEEARLNTLDALGYGLSPIIMANVYYNLTWQVSDANTWFPSDIQIPTLQIGGWYDHNIDEMMEFYEDSRSLSAAPVQNEQYLLVGPWAHGGTGAAYVGSSIQGELTYPTAEFKSDSMAWDFLQYYLLDAPNNWQNTDFITYFDMGGSDQWLTSNATNIAETNTDVLYLNANGQLTSGMGVSSSTFISDPANPSPTIGGATLHGNLDQGPYDQNSLDTRNDILTFKTATLTQDVSITGKISIDVYVSSDQLDGDVAIRLTDVYPNGNSMLITDGIQRLRFRNGDYTSTGEEFLIPGEIVQATIELPFTNYTWKAGHQIKIYVSGNHSIRFNVNLQDGGTMYQAGTGNIANMTIHHSSTYPSKINLPGQNQFLGIEAATSQFELYPNPANDQLNFKHSSQINAFTIIDLSGKIVLQGNPNSNVIDIHNLESGSYILQMVDLNEEIIQQQFVKQ